MGERVPAKHRGGVVIEEVERLPALLNGVHRLMESRRVRFALTGSSARKLRARSVNLLAGRAQTMAMHRLTVVGVRSGHGGPRGYLGRPRFA